METIASQASPFVDQTKLANFHEFIRAYTDTFTKNIHSTKDYTYKNLIENKDLGIISGDKDSCVVILRRSDYDKKLQSMVDEGITESMPQLKTFSDLKKFQDFLRRNFKDNFTHYKDIRPVSNQPGRLYRNNSRKLKIPTHNFTSGYIHVQCRKGYS